MEQDHAWCEVEEALTQFEANGQFEHVKNSGCAKGTSISG